MKPITPDDQPDIVPIHDDRGGRLIYRLRDPWEWEWNGITLLGNPGFIFDGASIPRLARSISGWAPDGLHRGASCAHDIGCKRKGVLISGAWFKRPHIPAVLWGNPPDKPLNLDYVVPVPREYIVGQLTGAQVHAMWGDLLRSTEGTKAWKNWVLHSGVRLGGPRWDLQYPAWKT